MMKNMTFLALAVTALFAIQHFRSPRFSAEDMNPLIVQASDASFRNEVASGGEWVLVDFWAPWCGPCLQLKPTFNALATDNAGRITFMAMNVDETRATAEFYNITGIPALVLLHNGTEVARWTGPAPQNVLQQWLDGHVRGS